MQLETIKPSCERLAAPSFPFEGFMPWNADVFTSRKRRGVNEGNALRAATTALHKGRQRDQQIRHRLDKAVVVARLVVVHQNREHSAVIHAWRTVAFLVPLCDLMPLSFRDKGLTKVICIAVNLC